MLTVEGEKFNPTSIENEILSAMPFLGHAMAIGDGRQYLACLLTMNVSTARVCFAWGSWIMCVCTRVLLVQSEVDMETCEPLDRLTPESAKAVASLGSSATMVSQVGGTEGGGKMLLLLVDPCLMCHFFAAIPTPRSGC